MNREKEEKMVFSNQYRNLAIIAMSVSSVVLLGFGGYFFFEMNRYKKELKHKIENLDSKAISPKENPFKIVDKHRRFWISYDDIDNDGDYESILKHPNIFTDDTARIELQKGLEGKINYVNLSENAIKPLEIYNNPLRLSVDYVDVDDDGKLESVTYLDINRTKLVNLESIDGKYVFSEVKN